MSAFRHRIQLAHPIESRDGTLNADSKMKNMVVENVEGDLVAVKRPGVALASELPPGLAQGLFNLNGMAYGIVNDTLYGPFTPGSGGGTGGGGWVQIPGVLPFQLEKQNFVGPLNGSMVAIATAVNDQGGLSNFLFSSTDCESWTRSSYSGGVLGTSGKVLLKDGVLLGYHEHASDWNKLGFGRSSDGAVWQAKEIPTPFDAEINQQLMDTYFIQGLMVVHGGRLLAFIAWRNGAFYLSSSTDGEVLSNVVKTNLYSATSKFLSHNGAVYALGGNSYTQIRKSVDSGVTWLVKGFIDTALVDCISTAAGILIVLSNNQTWLFNEDEVLVKKDYTLPSSPMTNGHLVALGTELFMLGCGPSYNTAFKLVDSSTPVGVSL